MLLASLAAGACVEINPAFYESGTGEATAEGTTAETAGPSPLSCEDQPEAVVFCSDFEEGTLELWDDVDPNLQTENVLALDPGPRGAENNHVMRLRIPPGPGGVDLVKLLPGYYDALYTRWYVQWEPGYDFASGGLGGGLHAGDRALLGTSDRRPSGDDRFSIIHTHTPTEAPRLLAALDYVGMYQDCTDPQNACYRDHLPCLEDPDTYCTQPAHREADPPTVLQTGRWYCVEMFVDGGTPTPDAIGADGQLAMWIDGAPMGHWDDLWLRTSPELKLNVLWLLLYHGGDHGDEGVLYDDIVVSRERVGCL